MELWHAIVLIFIIIINMFYAVTGNTCRVGNINTIAYIYFE